MGGASVDFTGIIAPENMDVTVSIKLSDQAHAGYCVVLLELRP